MTVPADSAMFLVLTNDDGIDAPGIAALTQAVQPFTPQVAIAAPQQPHSGCGHQVTTNRPIAIEQRAAQHWAIAGTPADCTRLALTALCPEAQWVLAGINAGGNLGTDVYISGTVAAVREAALRGMPAIAISHYIKRGQPIDWTRATALTTQVLTTLLARSLPPGAYWNVNLPHLPPEASDPELVFCAPCRQPLPACYAESGGHWVYTGEYGDRARDPGADVDVCFSGQIAVTQLQI